MQENNRVEGVVIERKSRKIYLVELPSEEIVEMHLTPSQVWNYVHLSIGAKVFVLILSTTPKLTGRLLTGTDFKLNNWPGWSSDYEPNYPS